MCGLIFLFVGTGARGGGPCASQLPGLIERLIQQPEHKTASYGILIERPLASNASSSLFALNPQVKMVPASNTKVLTSAALFLNTDASKFTFKTPFFVSGSGQQGKTISAPLSLCVKGMGDPSLAYADLERAAAMYLPYSISISSLLFNIHLCARVFDLCRLHDKGIFELDSLVIDDSFFHGQGQPFPCKNSIMISNSPLGYYIILKRSSLKSIPQLLGSGKTYKQTMALNLGVLSWYLVPAKLNTQLCHNESR